MPFKLTKCTKLIIIGVVGTVVLISGIGAAVVFMKGKSDSKGGGAGGGVGGDNGEGGSGGGGDGGGGGRTKDPRILTDYCRIGLCKKGKGKHIGCEHSGQFEDICQEAVMVDMTPARQKALVDGHNNLRNLIANGSQPDYEPAKRMQKLVWDDELAYLSELNAKQCKMLHDPCRSVDRFRHSGQNLAIAARTSKIQIDKEMLDMLDKWYDENFDATQEVIDIYPGKRPAGEREIGHFTAMVTDKSRFVGCGASVYRKVMKSGNIGHEILLACNYSYTNMKTQPIYKKGPPCSECITPCLTPYEALCSGDEGVRPVPD